MRTKEWLKDQRGKNNLTQRELANKIGISPYTIEQIEQNKRLGSAETWEKIENYFNNEFEEQISFDSEDLIREIKSDIEEFGEDHQCILIYKNIGSYIFFTNYDFIVDEQPFEPEKELQNDEKYMITSLQYALEVFESQNATKKN